MSWIFVIFAACVSDSEPPNTVKSLAKTKTVRPFTVPQPVTTPSPGNFLALVHAEIDGAMLDEHVELFERVAVHQQVDALARRQLAARMLRLDPLFAAAEPRLAAPLFQPVENVHDVSKAVAPVIAHGDLEEKIAACSSRRELAHDRASTLPWRGRVAQSDSEAPGCVAILVLDGESSSPDPAHMRFATRRPSCRVN